MSPEEKEALLGARLRSFRINMLRMDQATFAAHAGISERTLRNLESGNGSSLRTFVLVMTGMDRFSWLLSAAPEVLNPVVVTRKVKQRKRVFKPRAKTVE
ncbi:hypothetical protein J8I26_06575 [Herbaspirillum sp. LeCh32-8]|uniref:hypothetical protein n=1 Tax=Herbaspirillum sp. LeCh32-8 TaxID=2821356 RepID=UPI001AE0F161|nr:hypothetical protein [Herbaspirillum sp. LeCh32-8]MBP0597758.1 hypothetical protein [Herbaspirillum sp. LeCh32-8]